MIHHELDHQLLYRKDIMKVMSSNHDVIMLDEDRTNALMWSFLDSGVKGNSRATSMLANHVPFNNTFIFDFDDQECFWGNLRDKKELKEYGAVNLREAKNWAFEWKSEGEAAEKLEAQAAKELEEWKKAYLPKV